MHGFVEEIGVALIAATVLGLVTQKLGQPIILGYFIAGALAGPEMGLGWVSDPSEIELISEIGLVLLLFVIGLEIDLPKIMKSGKSMLVTGVGQFIFCVALGLVFFGAMGFGWRGGNLNGLYLALLCSLSSTALVVKLLYDKLEMDTLHGRISLGVLVLQDIWAVLVLAFQPNFNDPRAGLFVMAILKSAVLIGVSYYVGKWLMKRVFKFVAKSPELIVASALGWCAAIAGTAKFLDLSKEMGALVAGAVISVFPFSIFVTAKVLPLRDFFLTLFFVSLGMKIPHLTGDIFYLSMCVVGFVVVSRFLTVYPLLSMMGSGRRTAFIASLNLAQVSEFSLVIAALGLSFKHIDQRIMTVVIYSMAFTSIISSYLIQFSYPLFNRFDAVMTRIGFGQAGEADESHVTQKDYPIVILGFHRGARAFIDDLAHRSPKLLKQILVVDYNVEVLKDLSHEGIAGVYGDISHADTLEHVNLKHARFILSTVPDILLKGTKNVDIVRVCRSLNRSAHIIATADFAAQIHDLKQAGASEVVLPYSLAGKMIVDKVVHAV